MSHPLAGHASVDGSARRVGHYRWLEERLLRILGGWIALTPELPVKLLFGRHVWDCAQHADLWGRRLPELRAAARGVPPSEGFAHLVELVDGLQARHESIARVVAVYRVLKPHLVAAYRHHLAETNPIYEPPTRRILIRCLEEERRHVAAGEVILARLRVAQPSLAEEWEQRLREELGRVEGLAGAGAPAAADAVATPDTRGDLVALDSIFDPAIVDGDLAPSLDAHRRAVVDGDLGAVVGQTILSARDPVLETYRGVGPLIDAPVVACARIGDYRFVKLALRGAGGISVVQLEWRRHDEAGWQIAGAEIVRSEPAV